MLDFCNGGEILKSDEDFVPVLLEEGSYLPQSTVEKYGEEIMKAINSKEFAITQTSITVCREMVTSRRRIL